MSQVFLLVLRLPLSASLHQCAILTFIFLWLLSEGKTDEAYGLCIRQSEEHWIEKYLRMVSKGLNTYVYKF